MGVWSGVWSGVGVVSGGVVSGLLCNHTPSPNWGEPVRFKFAHSKFWECT